MYNEDRVNEYIIKGNEMLKGYDETGKDTEEMENLAYEICRYFINVESVPEFKTWHDMWESSPTSLKLVINKLEDWKRSHNSFCVSSVRMPNIL